MMRYCFTLDLKKFTRNYQQQDICTWRNIVVLTDSAPFTVIAAINGNEPFPFVPEQILHTEKGICQNTIFPLTQLNYKDDKISISDSEFQ